MNFNARVGKPMMPAGPTKSGKQLPVRLPEGRPALPEEIAIEGERWRLIECCLEAGEVRFGSAFPREIYQRTLALLDAEQIRGITFSFLAESDEQN